MRLKARSISIGENWIFVNKSFRLNRLIYKKKVYLNFIS
jgi:hypothetical protein